jgi:hypothetical protein
MSPAFNCGPASQKAYLAKLVQDRPGPNPPGIAVYPSNALDPATSLAALGTAYFYRPGELLIADDPTQDAYLHAAAAQIRLTIVADSGSYVRPLNAGYSSVAVAAPPDPTPSGARRYRFQSAQDIDAICQALMAARPSLRVTPNHVVFGCPIWALEPMGSPSPANAALVARGNGTGIKVAVLDSGLPRDYNSPVTGSPLLQNVRTGPNEYEPYPWQPPAGSAPATITWPEGHGSFVAGMVVQGAANADITSYRVLDKDNTTDEWALGNQLAAALADKPDIVNLSLGAPTRANLPLLGLGALAKEAGPPTPEAPIVIAAAGNLGLARLFYPAAEGWTISVGATDDLAPPEKACFSDYAGAGGTRWVDVCSLGVALISSFPAQRAVPQGGGPAVAFTGAALWNGTSFATPHVSAAVANLVQANPATRASGRGSVVAALSAPVPGAPAQGRITGPAGAAGPTWDIGFYVP